MVNSVSKGAAWSHVSVTKTIGRNHPDVTCNYCDNEWSSKEPDRVKRHLGRCLSLPDQLRGEYQERELRGKKRSHSVADMMSSKEQEQAATACAQWIYSAGLPFSTTEHPAFKAFTKCLQACVCTTQKVSAQSHAAR